MEAAADDLVRAGCRALAICFLHSYVDGRHEREAARLIHARHPDVYVSTSHELWPQRREYERGLVTVINAHVGGRMREYFGRLRSGLLGLGSWRAPILSMRSNGGVMTARSAGELPVHTLFSGPAAGVMGAAWVARQAGWPHVITLDMGGTSADVSIVDGDPSYSTEASVGEFPVIMPSVDISSIGAGGGSIARVDAGGLLKVGPQSAGSDPGPACYGRGGVLPTVTDAYVTLGVLHPDRFLGGELRLDAEQAHAALDGLGRDLQMDRYQAAWAVLEVATANMYAQLTPLLAKRGVDPAEYAFLPYGGAGPTHVFLLAREVGIPRVVVPPLPGALCALGCLVADLRADFVSTLNVESTHAAPADRGRLPGPRGAGGGVGGRRGPARRRPDARAVGGDALQGPVVRDQRDPAGRPDHGPRAGPVRLPRGVRADLRLRRSDGTPRAGGPAAPGRGDRAATAGPAGGGEPRPADPPDTRRVYLDGGFVDAGVYQRAALRPGDGFTGPAVVEQYDTTVLVPSGYRVRMDGWGNLIGEAERS